MAAKGLKLFDLSSPRVISEEEAATLEVLNQEQPPGVLVPGGGYVYVLQEGNGQGGATGLYKVGSSGDPATRRGNLQTGNPRPLGILHVWQVNDMTTAERAAHQAVAGFAAGLGGGREWYAAAGNQQLQNFLQAINAAVAGL